MPSAAGGKDAAAETAAIDAWARHAAAANGFGDAGIDSDAHRDSREDRGGTAPPDRNLVRSGAVLRR